MESMIKRGARLIIPASFGYLEPALRVAQRNPEVKFAHPGGYKRLPNLTTYWASTPEAFYLLGMAAGKVTKTNKIGYVVALPISFFLANVNAFELGARSVNPQVETRVVFTGTFLDPAKEATAAAALLDQGADVLGVMWTPPSPWCRRPRSAEPIRSAITTSARRSSRPRGGSAAWRSPGVTSTRASRSR
jgi:basic membrane lipoprotein Med (substrate-binding protein (PBP1-ABC) superfamily)